MEINGKGIAGLCGIVVAGLLGMTIIFGSWYTVDQGERVVVTRNGAVVAESGPGMHLKMPWIDSKHIFDVKTDKMEYNKITGHTADQQQIVDLTASLNYHVDPANVQTLYGQLGDKYQDVKISPAFLYLVGVELGKVSAQQLINHRDDVAASITKDLQDTLLPYHIIVESVQLQNPQFNKAFEDNINALVQQEVAVRTQEQALNRERIDAEIAVTKARGVSDSVKAAADGEAYKITAEAKASADAIKIKMTAMGGSAHDYVDLIKAEKWGGQVPSTELSGATPFISLGDRK